MSNFTFCTKSSIASIVSLFANKKSRDLYHSCLMYHSICKERNPNDLYSLSITKFQQQIELLFSDNFNVISFSSSSSGLSITFDDGHLDNYTLVAPYLLERQIPFTIFMISDFVSPSHEKYLNKEHLIELARSPLVTIGAHGKTHRPLAKLSFDEAKEELRVSKMELENVIGKEVDTMSFPHGSFDNDLLQVAMDLGYKKCGTSVGRGNPVESNSIQVDRHCIFSCDSRFSFKQKIDGKWDWLARDIH